MLHSSHIAYQMTSLETIEEEYRRHIMSSLDKNYSEKKKTYVELFFAKWLDCIGKSR